jgi:hypothetical protein
MSKTTEINIADFSGGGNIIINKRRKQIIRNINLSTWQNH